MRRSVLQPFKIDKNARSFELAGHSVQVGARAFDVLAFLDDHADRVVSKQELLEHVWGGLAVEEGNLSVQISALRKLLGADAIATVPGVGYKLTQGAWHSQAWMGRRFRKNHLWPCCPLPT
jgi:DNA-binding winged helix-turn-helix (wHTH) protein